MPARMTLPAAASPKALRQPKCARIEENISGVQAPPMPAPAAIQPQTRARAEGGFQLAFIFPLAG